MVVYTWGYQGRTTADLREVVEQYGIDLIVDVRGNPFSRRPGWRKESLEEVFGDRYRWVGWLGNKRYREGGEFRLRDPRRGMAELSHLVQVTGARRVLLLCYERDWRGCHRREVADLAKERFGARVEHLG